MMSQRRTTDDLRMGRITACIANYGLVIVPFCLSKEVFISLKKMYCCINHLSTQSTMVYFDIPLFVVKKLEIEQPSQAAVAHTINHSIWGAESGGSLEFEARSQPGLQEVVSG